MGFISKKVSLKTSTLSNIKKRAVAEGTFATEIMRRALEAAFDNPEVSLVGPRPGAEPETIRKVVEELLGPDFAVRMELLVPQWMVDLKDMKLGSPPARPECKSGTGIPPEVVRYLVETQAHLYNLVKKVIPKIYVTGITNNELKDWFEVMPPDAQDILEKLNPGGEK